LKNLETGVRGAMVKIELGSWMRNWKLLWIWTYQEVAPETLSCRATSAAKKAKYILRQLRKENKGSWEKIWTVKVFRFNCVGRMGSLTVNARLRRHFKGTIRDLSSINMRENAKIETDIHCEGLGNCKMHLTSINTT
jgi:hypothetical protein